MTVCGFNQMMADSLRMLAESFIQALEERASRDQCTVNDILLRETVEIPVVCSELSTSSQLGARMFHSFNGFALVLFQSTESQENPSDYIRAQMESFIQLLCASEEHNQSLPQPINIEQSIKNAQSTGKFAINCAR
jgi:hypothetical protein